MDEKQPSAMVRDLVEVFMAQARSQLVDSGEVAPAVLVCHGQEAEVLPINPGSGRQKDQVAFVGRELVRKLNAHTVVMITESWALRQQLTPLQYQELRAKYDRVEDMPGRVECVAINVETRDGEVWHAQAVILRKGRAVQTGPVAYHDMSGFEMAGRFCGWFAPQRAVPDDLAGGKP